MSCIICQTASCLYGAARTAAGIDEFVRIITPTLIALSAEHCVGILNTFKWMDRALQGTLLGNLGAHGL